MSERPGGRDALPALTLDLDGVICGPILGQNVGIHRAFLDPDAAPRPAALWPRSVAEPWDRLRYNLRRPLPEAAGALRRLHAVRRLVLLTGRRADPGWWLRRHGLAALIDAVVINRGPLRSPHYKLEAMARLDAREHVDDDPRTAQLLAVRGGHAVFLRDWPRNRGIAFDDRVRRVRDLAAVADALAGREGATMRGEDG